MKYKVGDNFICIKGYSVFDIDCSYEIYQVDESDLTYCIENKEGTYWISEIELEKYFKPIAGGRTDCPSKEEFQVKELGYYETEEKQIVQIIYKLYSESEENKDYVGILKNTEEYSITYYGNGTSQGIGHTNLIKYLGKELPKEPRKFEFDSILEIHDKCFIDFNIEDTIVNEIRIKTELKKYNGKKFKVLLEEIIE